MITVKRSINIVINKPTTQSIIPIIDTFLLCDFNPFIPLISPCMTLISETMQIKIVVPRDTPNKSML